MEDVARDVAAFLIAQGPLGILVLFVTAWGFLERRARDKEVEAHNETREKRIVEYKAVVAAIDKLDKSIEIMITAFRAKGDH